VFEGYDTRFVPTAVATVACGGLCAAAVVVPLERLPRFAALAVTASGVLSVVSANLSQRPEHTPGLVELCALLALVARAVRQLRPVKAAFVVTGASVAVGLVPLRLSEVNDEHLSLMETALILCLLPAVLAGLCLWLRDRLRARERESIRQAQRLEYARELHDFVAHHVTAIVAQTKAARFTAAQGREPDPAELDRMLEGIEHAASQSLGSMRSMVSTLRRRAPVPRPSASTGLGEVLKRAVDEFSVAGPPPVTVTVDPQLAGRRVAPELADVVHGVVREALTNARRYALGATSVVVAACPRPGFPGRLEISVTDDGRDESGELGSAGGGFGLTGLAERVEGAGGGFTAGPREGGPGWGVTAELPLSTAV
jgi:signal transduction histidine kinase